MTAPHPEPPRARKPALKLVKTQELSRDDWLAVRRTDIGGSDAAAAVGLNPYMSALELWLDKTRRADGLPRPDPDDTTSPTYWGTLLEPIVAASYTKQTGSRVRRVNAVLRHPTVPFMLANIDREIVGARDVQVLECKTAGEFGARLWRDGVPEYVQIQVQHQLAVTGKSAAHVAVLLCGQALEVHRIERDDALIGWLIELEARFWRFVETDTPPPADGSESADRALRHLYPGNGETINFSNDRLLSATFADLVAVRAEIETRQQLEAQFHLRKEVASLVQTVF
ncbi:YqaJ viral recombinase family nuclease [Burkholderia ubonensis]|uniref:YqaJ viral recombinase family nuclease n=1 Tax=Burkholderia ubonensis TaxID=101571 RepID=UPI000A87A3E7|nr:YqaJ viral recombinase family protein [Burkholderia ubonensis]